MSEGQRTQAPVNGLIPGFCVLTCGRSSGEEGLTGACFSERASLSLSCGVGGWALGKKVLSAPGTEPEFGGGIKLFFDRSWKMDNITEEAS